MAEAGDAASDPLAEIGEDDAFPDLGTPDLDVDDYALDLDYDPGTGRLEGTATLEATLARDADQIELDFQGLAVDAASVDGEAVDHESTADKVVLELAGPTEAGTDVTIEIDYSGVPEPVPTEALGGVEVGWHGGDDGSFVLSEPEGASTWYPVNNHPLDKATYTFRVTVPEPYAAIANGALLSRTPGAGGTTFEWRMAEPMASYLATVITGEFDEVDGGVHDDVAYSYWYAAGVAPSPTLEQSDVVVAELARRLGPFPFGTYGGVVYPPSFITGDGRTQSFLSGVALENQGRSLFAEGATVPSVVIHEAAHQWMGDNVSLTDWSRDIWWIEGFAHFAEYIDDVDAMADSYPAVSRGGCRPATCPSTSCSRRARTSAAAWCSTPSTARSARTRSGRSCGSSTPASATATPRPTTSSRSPPTSAAPTSPTSSRPGSSTRPRPRCRPDPPAPPARSAGGGARALPARWRPS